jgi:puromycin-sensitive aminopeptidase
MPNDPYRLPAGARPRRYDVRLAPDLDRATFSGTVRIALDIDRPASAIVLNAADLEVTAATIDGLPATTELDATLERLTVRPAAGTVLPGSAVLELTFTGTLNDRLKGFYRSTYTDSDGRTRVIATTQMQPTDCRRAFPCWDEPEYKAVFAVTLVVPADLLAVSNGRELSRQPAEDGRHVVQFADTMPMSTYLVAMVVGPLEATPWVDVDGTPIRIVHVPGRGHLTAFGLDCAAAGLRYFEQYFGIPYPSDKIDFLALPDFGAGAMENLGCITFREPLLLLDEATTTQAEQERVVDVVVHEIAHMWFGDLVTMRWWNGIWLNEAFATFMQLEATDSYRPGWQRWSSFAIERAGAYEVDALASTRSVEFPVHSPADADGMFDVLTYQKGGALLRMLQQYLGPDRFRDGVRHYLQVHSYGSTETSDLWDALEHTSGDPVRQLMDSWIWQPGFPVVSASLVGDELVLRQERFGYTAEAREDPARWMVPVHVREIGSAGDVQTKLLLTGDRLTHRLSDPSATIVVNAGGFGCYRVVYDPELRRRLTGHGLAALTSVDRYQLVSDAWAAVVAGRLDASAFLDFVRAFADETDTVVWEAVVTGIVGCDRLVDGEAREQLAGRIRALLGPAVRRLGWERQLGEDQLTAQLRALLVRTLATLGRDPEALARCRSVFEQGVTEPTTVDPEMLAAATTAVAGNGDSGGYDRLVELFHAAATPQETLRYLYALAEFPDPELVGRACEFALSPSVRTQNAPFLLARAIANRDGGHVAWRHLREHWSEAVAKFPVMTLDRMVDPLKFLDRPEDGADLQAFFAEHPIPQAAKKLEQVLERQRVNISLRAAQAGSLAASLIDRP